MAYLNDIKSFYFAGVSHMRSSTKVNQGTTSRGGLERECNMIKSTTHERRYERVTKCVVGGGGLLSEGNRNGGWGTIR